MIMKKSKINKEYIAPATQLFTPDWIVKYMVEKGTNRIEISNGDNEPIINKQRSFISEEEFKDIFEELGKNLSKKAIYKCKIDNEKADYEKILSQLREKYGKRIAPFHVPWGGQPAFHPHWHCTPHVGKLL